MLLGAEIGLLVYGLYALVAGKYSIGKRRAVVGGPARVLGLICILPLPIAFGMGLLLGLVYVFVFDTAAPLIVSTVLEIVILIVTLIVVSVLGKRFYAMQAATEGSRFE